MVVIDPNEIAGFILRCNDPAYLNQLRFTIDNRIRELKGLPPLPPQLSRAEFPPRNTAPGTQRRAPEL